MPFFAQGSEVTQEDLDAISRANQPWQPPILQATYTSAPSYDPRTFRYRPRSAPVQGTPAEVAVQLAQRAQENAIIQASIVEEAKTKARSEIGLLALLTAPAWGTMLFTFLMRR